MPVSRNAQPSRCAEVATTEATSATAAIPTGSHVQVSPRATWLISRKAAPAMMVTGATRRLMAMARSRISPSVTRSQKQTMRPYAGSAAMRSASA